MQVTITYHDNDSLLIEEVVRQAKNNYGDRTNIKVAPESDTPIDHLYFAIQRLITGEHLTLLYDSGSTYQKDLEKLRAETMYKLGEVLNEVLMDNEFKIHQEN